MSNFSELNIKADIFPKVLIVLVVYTVAVLGIAALMTSGEGTLEELVTQGIAPSVTVAMLVAVGAVALWRIWKPTGFTGVVSNANWVVVLIPAVLVGFLLFRGLTQPSFDSSVILFVGINTLFVGIGEEVMFRGLLFSGSYNRFSYWQAIILVTVIFGAIHSLNGFITGDFGAGIAQSILAGLSGFLYMAIRLGTGSIIPAVIIHWLWDFSLFINPATSFTENSEAMTGMDLLASFVPLTPPLLGIIGLIALWRLKKHIDTDSTA